MPRAAGVHASAGEGKTLLRLLGEPVLDDPVLVRPLGGCDKRLLLIALVALEGELSREDLAGRLWPELGSGAARNNLRQLLHHLHTLETGPAPLLAVSRRSVALDPSRDVGIDVPRFTRLAASREPADWRAASELYRGPFLNDCLPPEGLDTLEEWVFGWRTCLEQQYVAVLRALLEAAQETRDPTATGEWAARLVALEPWDEAAHCALIRARLRRGEYSAARADYRAMVDSLDRELGVTPSREAEMLLEELDSEPPGLASTPRPVERVAGPKGRRRVTAVYLEFELEDGRELASLAEGLRERRERVRARFERAEGYAVNYFGSGLLVYFGYPMAREDAAQRAVATTLAVVGEVPGVRAAIHAGLVVSGISAGAELAGETPAHTLCLRHRATFGEVVISASVHALVSGYFDCERLSDEQPVWCVRASSGARDRIEARQAPLSPLVGRGAELETLRRWMAELQRGVSRIALVEGEAGVGKSRLLHVLARECPSGSVAVRHMRCLESMRGSPFWPIIDGLARFSGLDPTATAAERRSRFRGYLATYYTDPEPVLETLWPLMQADAERIDSPRPPGEIQKTLIDLLGRLRARYPVLFFIEDLHWADRATLELLRRLAGVIADGHGPLLVLASTRAAGELAGGAIPGERVVLEPLSTDAAHGLVAAIAGGRLGRDEAEHLVRRCDGVPLYLEEAVRMVVQTGESPETIPATLQDLLLARIDALDEWRGLARIAATLRYEFDRSLLAAVSGSDPETVEQGLERLLDEGVLVHCADTENGALRFRHAMLQDAAYRSQLRQDRVRTHGRIARVVREQFPDLAEQQPEWLAHHLEAAGERGEALREWRRGAELATRRSAHGEAMGHIRHALTLLDAFPSAAERDREELLLRIVEGALYLERDGFGSESAGEAFGRAWALCQETGTEGWPRFFSLWGLWQGSSSRRTGRSASFEMARELEAIARASGESGLLAQSHYALANNHFFRGCFHEACDYAERAMNALPEGGETFFGEDPRILARAFMGWGLWYRGRVAEAREHAERAVEDARARRRGHDLGMVLTFQATTGFRERDPELVRRATDELLGLAGSQELALWQLSARAYRAWLAALAGDPAALDGIRACRESVREAMASVEGFFITIEIAIARQLGEFDAVRRALDEAAVVEARFEDAHDSAELRRLRGLSRARDENGRTEARACLYQAHAIAELQAAWQTGLRIAIDLCEAPDAGDAEWALLRSDAERVAAANGHDPQRLAANRDWRRARALLSSPV